MILLNINWSRISCVWCYSCRWWAARCSELNFRCNNAFEAEYLWTCSCGCCTCLCVCSSDLLRWTPSVTTCWRCHRTDSNEASSDPQLLRTPDLQHTEGGGLHTCPEVNEALLFLTPTFSWWDFTYFIITFTVSLILVLFSQKQPAEKTIVQHQTRNHRSILTAASQLRYWWQI